MPVSAAPTPGTGVRVRRPLTATELDFVRWRIHNSETSFALVHSVVAAVFDALLTDLGETHTEYGPHRRLDPNQFAIPQVQWTAIATAMTERARAWGSAIEVGMELANRMPFAYDDPDTAVPDLGSGDGRPHMFRLDVTREAADEIAACEAHIQALAGTYGPSSQEYQLASHSWRGQLAALVGPRLRGRSVVRRDGRLSLHVTTDDGFVFGVVFHGERRRCTVDGCHAAADTAAEADQDSRWRPAYTDAVVLDHDHQPSYPFGAPQPGSWSAHS